MPLLAGEEVCKDEGNVLYDNAGKTNNLLLPHPDSNLLKRWASYFLEHVIRMRSGTGAGYASARVAPAVRALLAPVSALVGTCPVCWVSRSRAVPSIFLVTFTF